MHFLSINGNDSHVNNHFEGTILSLHKMNEWTQDVNNRLIPAEQPPPPRIPPHLLNILLNRKLPPHVCFLQDEPKHSLDSSLFV